MIRAFCFRPNVHRTFHRSMLWWVIFIGPEESLHVTKHGLFPSTMDHLSIGLDHCASHSESSHVPTYLFTSASGEPSVRENGQALILLQLVTFRVRCKCLTHSHPEHRHIALTHKNILLEMQFFEKNLDASFFSHYV